ncbi:hypothetical protein H8S21_17185 [Erwinia persicina]|nr:hypothetical protein [Erwinia persicina]
MHIAPPALAMMPLTGASVSWQVGIAWDGRTEDRLRDHFIAGVKTRQRVSAR